MLTSISQWQLEDIFLYMAVPASILLVIQTVLTLLGLGESDSDTQVDGFDEAPGDLWQVMRWFSLRNLVAFFTFFGWGGLWLMETDLDAPIILILATVIGSCFVGISTLIFYGIEQMQRSGTLIMDMAIGVRAEVYIPIPPDNSGKGKVSIVIQGALREVEAVTFDKVRISTGKEVIVTGLAEKGVLLVTAIDEQSWM